MMRRFEYKLFADYHHFYLQDECVKGDLSESWTQEAVDRLLAVAPGTIGVFTVRNLVVPVVVEVTDTAPDEDTTRWEQVNELLLLVARITSLTLRCDFEVRSGRVSTPVYVLA